MNSIKFTWDDQKNRHNIKKHSVSFEESETIFFDEHAMEFFDPEHSEEENRFIMLGMSYRLRILVVCYCYRKDDAEIRIISARKATKKEQQKYFGGKNEKRV